jgi:hypothetical protein
MIFSIRCIQTEVKITIGTKTKVHTLGEGMQCIIKI